ncbi:hypothetical protein [Pedobacter sp. MC2016-24]|uniref:hypothetical protein n=1 Tax=Pedobacter sp. MC2016-24 TaxID=2780090 RepID=UPI001880978A|nr:hypothetical protein [Pedobacter sp. MC2016-24]MBE9597941.1 hypothetical protein [Pedobacter sp. MC2016-24]
MGQIFELIADQALETLDSYYTECHICERENLDLYTYQGKYVMKNGEIDDDLYALCEECIKNKGVSHICDFQYIKTIEGYLESENLGENEKEILKQQLTDKYQKTPDIPIFLQYTDRPLCCKDITEFKGYPQDNPDLYQKTDSFIYWEKKTIASTPEAYNFKNTGPPESLREVATFHCKHCNKNYFTFQF